MNQPPAPADHPPAPYGLRLLGGLQDMSPAYFGMVMATGIISLAAQRMGFHVLAQALFALNIVVYAVLWLLTLLRMGHCPRRFFGDMVDHLRGPGFFTMVAGTCILGSQFVLLAQDYATGTVFWGVGITLWIALTYTIFTSLTIKEDKPTLDRGINGAWLLAIVATQSIAVLGALLAAHIGQPGKLEIHFAALSMWLWGGMLYIWMMSIIFYRYTFFRLSPGDLTPPYWINMGAMAISTLAGSLLIMNAPDAPFMKLLLPFVKGFTVFYWATGTWWIPMLLILGVWRYVYKRFPVEYDPLYWGAVFPLGMYAASTDLLIQAMGLDFLSFMPKVFFVAGLTAWTATFCGFVVALLRQLGGLRRVRRPNRG